jgi:hypothetical protein
MKIEITIAVRESKNAIKVSCAPSEAIELFQPVVIKRRVPLKSRKYFVRWIERVLLAD